MSGLNFDTSNKKGAVGKINHQGSYKWEVLTMVQMVKLEGEYFKPEFCRVIIDGDRLRLNNRWHNIHNADFGESYIEIGKSKVTVTVIL